MWSAVSFLYFPLDIIFLVPFWFLFSVILESFLSPGYVGFDFSFSVFHGDHLSPQVLLSFTLSVISVLAGLGCSCHSFCSALWFPDPVLQQPCSLFTSLWRQFLLLIFGFSLWASVSTYHRAFHHFFFVSFWKFKTKWLTSVTSCCLSLNLYYVSIWSHLSPLSLLILDK